MNNCIISGNLGSDPETFYTNDGTPITSFNMAFKSGKKTGWIKVSSFQKLAEIVEQHLKKGNHVVVSGSLDQEQWESEGGKRTSFKLIAQNIDFFHQKSDQAEDFVKEE